MKTSKEILQELLLHLRFCDKTNQINDEHTNMLMKAYYETIKLENELPIYKYRKNKS